jgi:Tol biopolymer transport system component
MQLTWFDDHGREIGHLGEPDDYYQVELSPDGKKAAAAIGSFSYVIWYDVKQNTRTRLTFGPNLYISPIWSHDGKQIAYMRGGVSTQQAILAKAADGSGEEKKLLDTGAYEGLQNGLCDWSPDGRYILYIAGTATVGNGTDIWALPLFGDRKPFAYIAAPGNQLYAQFSPDGRWVAYSSDESGTLEVYVAPFPWTGAKWQVSNGEALCRAGGGMESKSSFYEWEAAVHSALTLMATDRVSKWARCTLCTTSTIFLRTRQHNSSRSRVTASGFCRSLPAAQEKAGGR